MNARTCCNVETIREAQVRLLPIIHRDSLVRMGR